MSATDAATPKAPPWSPDDLFQPNHPGSCCTCCEGHCPISDEHVGRLYTVGVGGTLMISDGYVAIRGDMVAADPGWPIVPAPKDPGWTAPDSRPTESRALFTPHIAGRLLRLGIHIGQGGEQSKQPLHLGEQHIGWVMPARRGSTLTEVRRLLELSKELATDGNPRYLWGAGVDEDRLDAMAEALRWAREVGI